MKSVKLLFVSVIVLAAFSGQVFSQPKFVLHITGGLSVPFPDLKGDVSTILTTPNNIDDNYLMKLGFNFGADGKYAFDKKGNFRGVFGIGYNIFVNPADLVSIGTTINYRPTIGILTLSLGPEYAFLPKEKFNPFVGVDFTANFISGSYEYSLQTTTLSNITLESAARFGLQFGLGGDIKLGKNIGLVVGVKYNLANLIGKDSDTSKISATSHALNDAEYTYNNKTYPAKSISYVQIYSGITFYIGQPKKVVKK